MTKYTYTDSFVPESTLIKAAFYHTGEQNLFVKFHGVEPYYGYTKVSQSVWDNFVYASSSGAFYNLNVKAKFEPIQDIESVEFIGAKASRTVETHKFVIVGVSPIEYELEAASIEEAKADFLRMFPKGTLKEVRVSFE